MAPRCASFSEETAMQAFAPSQIESVEPAYSFVSSGPIDRQARLRGARVHLRPAPSLSRELLQRSLECHQSRVALGAVEQLADDPYVLPGAWLDIDVDSEGDGFVVAVRVDKLADAKAILERARRFATSRR
jgi:hypothetical protein